MAVNQSRERFVELAEKRVTRAIKNLRLIGNLSNRSNYSYTNEDVKKIISALESELRNLKRRFSSQGRSDEIIFKL
ncbi:hypothetical protein ES703_36806 [subsurface metagenome]